METNIIYNIDCLTGLRNLPDDSIDCCVTSPPYFNLRDYGVTGQIGLEESPEQYIQKLVGVFHEVKRVLAPAGTLWINIGDCYAGSGKGAANYPDNAVKYKQGTNRGTVGCSTIVKKFDGYKSKDLIGIPWMLAFALRTDGWFLRQDIIWAKPNPMPESMKDRCTKSHEYIFLLTKSPKYYFDCEAIHEKAVTTGTIPTDAPRYGGNKYTATPEKFYRTKSGNAYIDREFRNKRDVWTVPTQPLQEAHFATFPEKLVADCILAGCPENGIVLDPFMGSGSAGRFDVPSDADDFSRCYDLVTFAEVSPVYDLPRICEIFPWYKPIIDSWATLAELYEKQDYKGVYHLLSSKRDEVMCLQGFEKKGDGIWIKQ